MITLMVIDQHRWMQQEIGWLDKLFWVPLHDCKSHHRLIRDSCMKERHNVDIRKALIGCDRRLQGWMIMPWVVSHDKACLSVRWICEAIWLSMETR
jgi:hypothetical protein